MPHHPTLKEQGQSPDVLAHRQAELLAYLRHTNGAALKVALALGAVV